MLGHAELDLHADDMLRELSELRDVPPVRPDSQRGDVGEDADCDDGEPAAGAAAESGSGEQSPTVSGKVKLADGKRKDTKKRKQPTKYALFMQAKMLDKTWRAEITDKRERFKEIAREWSAANPPKKLKAKIPKVDLTGDKLEGKRKKVGKAATALPSSEVKKPPKTPPPPQGDGEFGCSRCRWSKTGCRSCNTAKAPAAEREPLAIVA